jgi:hypothetical protein
MVPCPLSVVPVELLPLMPLEVELLAVDPVDELLPMSLLLLVPMGLHAASDNAVILPMRMP